MNEILVLTLESKRQKLQAEACSRWNKSHDAPDVLSAPKTVWRTIVDSPTFIQRRSSQNNSNFGGKPFCNATHALPHLLIHCQFHSVASF